MLQLEKSVRNVSGLAKQSDLSGAETSHTLLVSHSGEYLGLCPLFKNQRKIHTVHKRKKAREQVGLEEQLS